MSDRTLGPPSSASFERLLADLVSNLEHWTGIDLHRGSARVALERYLRARVDQDREALAAYEHAVQSPHLPEVQRLIEAITVSHSSFFRDPEQLASIAAVLRADVTRPAAIWIPGCATGEDAYSLALVAESVGRPVTILATDISARALAFAIRGEFGPWSMRGLPATAALTSRPDGVYVMPPRLRRVITFERHNLMEPTPPCRDGWDVIVCRNVLMYFSPASFQDVLRRLGLAVRPGGHLFIGANDVLDRAPPPLQFVRIEQRQVLWRPPDGFRTAFAPPASVSAAPMPPDRGGTQPAPPAHRPSRERRDAAPTSAQRSLAERRAEPAPVAHRSSPDSRDHPCARALDALGRGDTSTALEMLLRILELDPLCTEARLLAGIAYHLAGDELQATVALRGALLLDPSLWPAEMYLGFALAKLGDDAGARRALNRCASLAAARQRLQLSELVAEWLEGWRVDAIACGGRGHAPSRR